MSMDFPFAKMNLTLEKHAQATNMRDVTMSRFDSGKEDIYMSPLRILKDVILYININDANSTIAATTFIA